MTNFDIARLAAQLARTSAARHKTVDEIARDAIDAHAEALRARRALESGRPTGAHVEKVKKSLADYGAHVVNRGDVAGCVLGIKFDDGSYRNGAGNVYLLA